LRRKHRKRLKNWACRVKRRAIGALGALAAGLIEAGRFGWANPWVLATFGAAMALLALFAGAVEPTG
jgi:hypothetical protein